MQTKCKISNADATLIIGTLEPKEYLKKIFSTIKKIRKLLFNKLSKKYNF